MCSREACVPDSHKEGSRLQTQEMDQSGGVAQGCRSRKCAGTGANGLLINIQLARFFWLPPQASILPQSAIADPIQASLADSCNSLSFMAVDVAEPHSFVSPSPSPFLIISSTLLRNFLVAVPTNTHP
ncbi:hypothetical protein Tco_0246521 [Tanacetum coccineum]